MSKPDCPNLELLPLSLLNDFLYCRRRAALKIIEGWREANAHTVLGDLVHEHADLPGYEVAKSVKVLRALPVWSERLGLSGKCDIVEVHAQPISQVIGADYDKPGEVSFVPVEYKKGKRRAFENDDAQLCAQAMCLEEMFGAAVPRGAVFHAQSKRRREVEFNSDLRSRVERSVADLRELIRVGLVPPALYAEGRCEECSLFNVCLPRLTRSEAASATTVAIRKLYQT